jgi:hypothetical protein
MDKRRFFPGSVSICFLIIILACVGFFITSCEGHTPQTPLSAPLSYPAATLEQTTTTPTILLPAAPSPTPTCTNNLSFISDVTIPDGTVVAPGTKLDKQWLVQNSGDCNWDTQFRLRLISGDALGATTEQALYPARSGTQATVRIQFTAPQQAGEYISEWQAFDANGIAFGGSFFIKIQVQ